jgi:acetyl esterase
MNHIDTLTLNGLPLLRVTAGKASIRRPVLLWLHSGKFSDGSARDALPLAKALAQETDVLLPDYPLAPKHPFPAALEAVFALLQWLKENGLIHRGLFVGGERAGGNIAAALALRARDQGIKSVAGQILLAPLLDPSQNTASMRAAADCPCAQAWRTYLANPCDTLHPYAAPLFATRLAGLPPALILTSDQDPARDEAEQYAARLHASGVSAQLLRPQAGESPLVNAHAATGEAALTLIQQFIAQHTAAHQKPKNKPRGAKTAYHTPH